MEVETPEQLLEWAEEFENIDNRRVAQDMIGRYRVSTVFLGLDHSFGESAVPVVFETMIFDEEDRTESKFFPGHSFAKDLYQERDCTWDEAVKRHGEAIALATEWVQKGRHEGSDGGSEEG